MSLALSLFEKKSNSTKFRFLHEESKSLTNTCGVDNDRVSRYVADSKGT